jgi:single-strand DNA-binding protein
MAGINKVILVGNLGKDPETRTLESGRKVSSFSLATTETYKDKNGERVDQTEWHNIVFWGPIADVIEKYLKKGSQIYVEGKIRSRSYEDKEGVKKYITEILGEKMTMLGAPKSSDSTSSSTSSSNGKTTAQPVGQTFAADEDDLPF